MDILNSVGEFLRRYEMHPDSIDIATESERFIAQMHAGLVGDDSSLHMIPTYITADGVVPANKKIIVIDAGGTNLRIATVYFDDRRQPVIDYFKKYPMPGSTGPVDVTDFFAQLADYLMPVVNDSDRIGVCFSYPAEIMHNHDGRVSGPLTKEVTIVNSEGAEIGVGIAEALRARGVDEPKHFVVLNDTVATLLGGKASYPDSEFETFIGFILGTGTNTSYIDRSENIKKSPDALKQGGTMAINCESGGYTGIAQGVIDAELDAKTANPGTYTLEKMISGAYQGESIFRTVQYAANDGLFSETFAQRLRDIPSITLREIDEFCFHPFGMGTLATLTRGSDADRITLYQIIDENYERAAKIATVKFAAILGKTGYGKDPTRPVCVCAEGTTFWKSKLFKGKLEYYFKDYIENVMQRHIEIVQAENATLSGTAVAGLLN